jgi:hypothetical protein
VEAAEWARRVEMPDEIDRLISATIKEEGVARTEPGEALVDLFSFDGAEPPVWMEVRADWVGANYKAIVSNFGIPDRASALSTHPGGGLD